MNCCICGAVKNCGPYLEKVFENIEKIGALFDDYRIVLYYDTSEDNTLDILKRYRQKNIKLEFYVNKNPVSNKRTIRIANARNFCIQTVYNRYPNYPFFIMMDFDDVCSNTIKIENLNKYLNRDDWDALSFNKNGYYDIWALSISPFFLSCHHFGDKCTATMQTYITNLLNNTPSGQLLQCASAFNGFSIYKTNKFINCYYDGNFKLKLFPPKKIKKNIDVVKSPLKLGLEEDCEHKAFHIEAINKNNARIRISSDILF